MESPQHVAIILDGNRRYAKKHNLGYLKGHEHGVKVVWDLFDWAKELEIKELSLYTLRSLWKRPRILITLLLISVWLMVAGLRLLIL